MSKKKIIRSIILKLVLGFITISVSPKKVTAFIRINEVYSHPITGQQEWIELHLPQEDSETNVGGWSVWDTESSPSLLFTFDAGTYLSAGDYFVITMSNKLNNSGDTLVLKDLNYNFIDVFSYTGGESEKSWSLLADESIKLTNPTNGGPNLIPVTISPNPTPGINPTSSLQPSPTSTQTQTHPKLTSFMACPKVGNEWVEINNPHQNNVYLENYELWDAKNHFYRFLKSDVLVPNQTLRVNYDQSVLNNSGDTLALYSPNNELVEETEYENCDSLIPWSKNNNEEWVLGVIGKTGNSKLNDNSSNSSTVSEFSNKILGDSTEKNSAYTRYSTFSYPPLPDLMTKTSPLNWNFSENVVFFETPLTIWGGLGVIIGGLLIGGSNLWNLYVEKQTTQLEKFP